MERGKWVEALGLPGEVVRGLPLVTLTGNREVYVENHRGLLAYQPEQVLIKTGAGRLCIAGRGLCLRTMDREALLVCGQIDSLGFDGGAAGFLAGEQEGKAGE